MAKVILHFSMSLDGFVAGPDVSAEQPMGAGGEQLHNWLFAEPRSRADAEAANAIRARVGAALVGRRTFEVGIGPWQDTPWPAPALVVTHRPRDDLVMKSGTFHFVTDGLVSAVGQAKAAAGGKDVVVMGADIAAQCLEAGLADEISVQIAPVLLGAGTRLFDRLGKEIKLVRTGLTQSPLTTHLGFRVSRQGQDPDRRSDRT